MIPRLESRVTDRGLHRAGPGANLLLLGAMLAVGFATPSILLKVSAVGLVVALIGWSGEGMGRFLSSLRFVIVFSVLLFAVQALVVDEGRILLSSPVRITDGGLVAGAGMALRFLVVLSSSFLFALVVDPDRLARSLIRLRVPYRYGYLLILALRFVPFFRREAAIVREAQRMRGIETSVRTPRALLRTIRFTFVPVLVSGLTRVDAIAMSMTGRCFGRFRSRTSAIVDRRTPADAMTLVLALAVAAAVGVSRVKGWP